MTATLEEIVADREGMRFSNRQYAAEWIVRHLHPVPRLDGTQKAAQQYVDRITRSAWWQRTCPASWLGDHNRHTRYFDDSKPPRRVLVAATRGTGGSTMYALVTHRGNLMPEIRLGRDDGLKNPWIILHEMAHIMAMSAEHQGHGREFARFYLLLVRRWLGPDAAAALRAAYAQEKVKYRAR